MFFALSDPTRRALVARLATSDAPQQEYSVGDLAAPFSMSLAAVSKHLKVLEDAGLLARRWQGRIAHCRLRADTLASASAWIEHHRTFWNTRLDALEDLLKGNQDHD